MEKEIKKYTKNYRKALVAAGIDDSKERIDAFKQRLGKMYRSDSFKKHSIYPTTSATTIYAVIAMCLELRFLGLSDDEIISAVDKGFGARRNFFKKILRCIDLFPFTWKIARKWNISDHDKRVQDGSITYDTFTVNDDRIEYSISKCMYIEMFETYGIRELCKIFCMTDTLAYENLPKHVRFVRHSDLSDGDRCHDEIIRR